MRTIYLIRHASTHRQGPRRCIGRTDLPLSDEGREQAQALGAHFRDIPLTAVYCSDLTRSRETAKCIRPGPIVLPGFREMDAGDWDGLTFDEIRERWPELYEQRGRDHTVPIPGGETFDAARIRFRETLDRVVSETEGDIAIVTHGSVLQVFLCDLRGAPLTRMRDNRVPWGGVVEIGFDGAYHSKCESRVMRQENKS